MKLVLFQIVYKRKSYDFVSLFVISPRIPINLLQWTQYNILLHTLYFASCTYTEKVRVIAAADTICWRLERSRTAPAATPHDRRKLARLWTFPRPHETAGAADTLSQST